MTQPSAPIPVVAAVVQDDGRYLVGRRPSGKRHGGLWEFPGGKVDDGESFFDATARELDEELGLRVLSLGEALFVARDGSSAFEIHFVPVDVAGTPRALEHSELRWCAPADLVKMELAPSDATFARLLASGTTPK